eukprot:1060285-Pyramimonas_sp.AAC.1
MVALPPVTNADPAYAPNARFWTARRIAGRVIVEVLLVDPHDANATAEVPPRRTLTVTAGRPSVPASAWSFPGFPVVSAGVTIFHVDAADVFGNN